MPSRCRFLRRTVAVLMACGLIASLLPGFAAAQDLSTREARAAWLIEQFNGAPVKPNGKFAAVAALSRLALNPDDAEVISDITHFYDKVPTGRNAEQFSCSGVAWVLGKYWDKFTPAQRDHLKAKLKGFDDLTRARRSPSSISPPPTRGPAAAETTGGPIAITPNVAKSICRTGLQARLFKCEIVVDLVSADLTKCEIFKQPQKDIYAL